MKSTLLFLVAAFTTAVVANPVSANPAHAVPRELQNREQCFHPSECKWTNSGQCEYHCDGYGGFMYMQGCGWGRKRCCCAKKT